MKPTISILFLSISLFASAQSWKREPLNEGSFFRESFSIKGCEVIPFSNGRGIDLRATGFHGIRGPKSQVDQSVRISLTPGGKVTVKQDWLINDDGTFILSEAIFSRSRPDIFATNCQKAAKLLPGRVQKLFFGKYGLGKIPLTKTK
jgi:hypothetical protein